MALPHIVQYLAYHKSYHLSHNAINNKRYYNLCKVHKSKHIYNVFSRNHVQFMHQCDTATEAQNSVDVILSKLALLIEIHHLKRTGANMLMHACLVNILFHRRQESNFFCLFPPYKLKALYIHPHKTLLLNNLEFQSYESLYFQFNISIMSQRKKQIFVWQLMSRRNLEISSDACR